MTRPPRFQLSDFDPPYRNTRPPQSDDERGLRYGKSRLFQTELAAVCAALEEKAENFCDEIFNFLKWFRPERTRFPAIAARLSLTPEEIRAVLEHYAFFAFRFRVRLHGQKMKSGELKITPVYEKISPDHLRGRLRDNKIIPVRRGYDPDEDYRWNLEREATHDPDQKYRWRNAPCRFFELIADDRSDSELMLTVDTFYDPLALNFLEIKRKISRTKSLHYLICFIGELSDGRAWRGAESMRTKMITDVYGASTRGRRADPLRTREGMRMAAKHGANVKWSAGEVIRQQGKNPGTVPDREYRRNEEAMRRANRAYKDSTSKFD